MVKNTEFQLIDFGIDFIRYKINNLTYNIRIFNIDYIEFELIELNDIEIFRYNSRAYNHLKSYKDEELDIFLKIIDNYFMNLNYEFYCWWSELNNKKEIMLNDLIYKIQEIDSIDKFKYFLYNKEQNRTITLYDHQIKFIQEHFNKT